MQNSASSSSSAAAVLAQSIKEDLTALITERQESAQRQKFEISNLNHLNRRQKEILATVPRIFSTAQHVLSETTNQAERDLNALRSELHSYKAIANFLSESHERMGRTISNSKTSFDIAQSEYSIFFANCKQLVGSIRTATEKIQGLRKEYDGHQIRIKAVSEEKRVMELQRNEIEKEIAENQSEKEKVLLSGNDLVNQMNGRKQELHLLETTLSDIFAKKEEASKAIGMVKTYMKSLVELNVSETLNANFKQVDQHTQELEMKKKEFADIENRHSTLERDLQGAADVYNAMDADVTSRVLRIEESKCLHAEMVQKVELEKVQKQQLCSENEDLQSEVNSRQLRLSEMTTEWKELQENERSLLSSCERQKSALCELNDKMAEKRAKLSQLEDANKKMKSLIERRDSLLNEVDSVAKACDTLRKEQHNPRLDRLNVLFGKTKELEQRKAVFTTRRSEVQQLIAEAKKRLELEETKRTAAEASLQEIIHEVQRLNTEFELLKGSGYETSTSEQRRQEWHIQLEEKRKILMENEKAHLEAYDAKVRSEAELIRTELKTQLLQVKRQSEESLVEFSASLAERLLSLRKELDSQL